MSRKRLAPDAKLILACWAPGCMLLLISNPKHVTGLPYLLEITLIVPDHLIRGILPRFPHVKQ